MVGKQRSSSVTSLNTVRHFSGGRKFNPDDFGDVDKLRIRLQEIAYAFNLNLYALLKVDKESTMEEIETKYRKQVSHYDPAITGNDDNIQYFEELTLAYRTLTDPKLREEYDEYLASVGTNIKHDEPEIDPEEIERRKRERGK